MYLDLLAYTTNLKIKNESETRWVWDVIRKKWVVFTPEEMVRQLFVYYLTAVKKIAIGLIAIEKEILLGKKIKRCDMIIYSQSHQPDLVIECKSPEVKLDDKVISQVVRYNQALDAKRLGIVNGKEYLEFEKGLDGRYELRMTNPQ